MLAFQQLSSIYGGVILNIDEIVALFTSLMPLVWQINDHRRNIGHKADIFIQVVNIAQCFVHIHLIYLP